MRCTRPLVIVLPPLLGLVALVATLFLPALSAAQPPSGSGSVFVVSDEGQAQTSYPDQFVDRAIVRDEEGDPHPNWRYRDFDDSGWGLAFPVMRHPNWTTSPAIAPLLAAQADHIWGGTPGGPLSADAGNGTAYANRNYGDFGYPLPTGPSPQYLFVRKNFCLPINTHLLSISPTEVDLSAAGPLEILVATDGSAVVWLNGGLPLSGGDLAGDESGNVVYSRDLPLGTWRSALERGRNTLSIRASDDRLDERAALLYSLSVTYNVDPNAIQVSASANPAYVGQTVNFGFSDDGLSGRSLTGWDWVFGDGVGTGSGPTPSYFYTAPGDYIVTLTLTDQDGCTGVAVYSISVVAQSDLAVSKVADRATVVAGDYIQYDLTVQNTGTGQPLNGVVVSDTLATGVSFVWCSDGCTLVGNVVRWDLGTLAPGETRVLQLRGQVDGDYTGAEIVNACRGSSAETGERVCEDVVTPVEQLGTTTPSPTDTATSTPTPTPTGTLTPTSTPTAGPRTPSPTSAPPRPTTAPVPQPTPTVTPTPTPILLLPATGDDSLLLCWPVAMLVALLLGLLLRKYALARHRVL